jgi:hypothetical protein
MYQGLVGLQDGYTTIVGGNGVHIGTGTGWESGLLFETSGTRATLSGHDPSSNYVTGTIAYLSDITGGGGGAAGFPITGNAVVLENPWEGGLELTASNSYGAPADKATLHMDMSNLYGQTADGGAFGIGGDYAHLVHPNGVWIGSGAGMGDYQGLKLQSSGTRFIIEDTGTIAYLSDIPGSAGGGFPLNGNHASLTNTGAGSLGILAGDSDEDVRGTIIIGTGGNNANGGDTNRITLSAEDGEVKIRNDGGEIKIRNDGGVSIGGENVSIGGNNNVTLQGNYMELNTNGDAINLGAATAVYLSGPELVHIKAVRGNVLIDAGSADEYMTGEVVIRPTGYDNDTGEYSRGGLIIRDAGDNNSVRLKGLAAAPSSADEAASKAYVDITAGGGLPGIATDADDGNDGPRIYADGKDLVLMTRQGSGDDYPNVSIRLSEHDIIFIYVSADGSQQVTLTGILAFMANMEERLSDAGF